jgi:signal transduction histidine kinase
MIGNNGTYAFQMEQPSDADSGPTPLPVELLLDTISRGIIFVSTDGVLTYMNKYAADILHVWQETVIGKRVDMLPLNTPLYKVLSEQCRGVPLEMMIKGQVIAAQSTAIKSSYGALCGELTEIWDVTEDKRSRRQWEEFVAMMAHDLRSPLTVIMGYIHGMQCGMFGKISNRLRNVVEKAEVSGKKLNSMIEEMLDIFRMEVGLLNLNRQSCNMGKFLEGCYNDNLRAAHEKGINLILDGLEGLPDLQVDSRHLMRVFNNLIGNAIKYTPDGGEVSIIPTSDENALHVTIADTGIGIPPEDLSRIFIKYYRSAGASGIKGTGLGLSISKTIVEAHGGGIAVESSIGGGSRFTVSIPFQFLEDIDSSSC